MTGFSFGMRGAGTVLGGLLAPGFIATTEPTNSLDLASARQLAEALSCYQGALVVVSHDLPFLRSVGITRWLRLERTGRLSDIDPPD